MKKVLTIILSLLVVAGACVFTPEVKAEAATAKLSKKSVKLEVGDSKKIKVKGTKTKAVWSTSDAKVATVKNGKITAKGEGTCKIVATVGTKKLTCKVTVNAKKTVAFDSTVKIGKVTFPTKSSWAAASDVVTEGTDGIKLITYLDTTSGVVRSIVYEMIPVIEEEYDELTEAEFEYIGNTFAEGVVSSTGAQDLKTEIVKESGMFYGKATGTLVMDGQELPFAMTYKLDKGVFVATLTMEAANKLSADAVDIAFEACKGAKVSK